VRRLRITGPARRDLVHVLRRSREEFGARASQRYGRLLERALQELADDPTRRGTRAMDAVRKGYFIYHLKWVARRTSELRVRRPRHLIAFHIDVSGDVIVARIFHERQMLARYLD